MTPVLADLITDRMRFTAAALAGCLDGGNGDEPELVHYLTAGRSYAELHALVLLLADCADPAKITQACEVNPGLAAANARRIAEASHRAAEYAHLRDGGVSAELAAGRVGLRRTRAYEAEVAYQERREAAA